MSKKIISIVMSLVVMTSIVGCGNKTSSSSSSSKSSASSTETSSTQSTSDEDDNLQGTWAKNYNSEELKKLYEEKLAKIKEITTNVGIQSTEDERITNEDNLFIRDKGIYFDNDNAQKNKIQNFYFGEKLYGEDSSKGAIELKIILNFDGTSAIQNNDFDMGETTLAKYIEAFSGKDTRDYSSINKEIIDKLRQGESQVVITNTIDGLKEEIIATKDSLFYKLSTKKYDFSKADNGTTITTTTDQSTDGISSSTSSTSSTTSSTSSNSSSSTGTNSSSNSGSSTTQTSTN